MSAARSRYGSLRPLVGLVAFSGVLAATGLAGNAPEPRQIVVRVSREALAPVVDMQVDRTTPVEDEILGTYVRGQARTTGSPSVEFVENPNQATFAVALKGATVSRTVGRNGPATIYTRAETYFTATTQIRFEPGKGFVAQPAKIAATTRAITEGIGSRRGGLIGRIVLRRAWRRVNESRPEVEAIARQKAERRITAAFDDYLQVRLARLNQMTDLKQAIALLLGGNGEPRFASRTTRDFVEIALSPAGSPMPVALPVTELPAAPVQVWFHRSIIGDQLANVLKLFDKTDTGANLAERALAAVPDMIKDRLGLPQHAAEARPSVNYQTASDWIVVQVGGEALTDAATAQVATTDQPRMWTSADGRYTCYAEKVSATSDSVTLKRMVDGQVVTVPLERLCETDRLVVLR